MDDVIDIIIELQCYNYWVSSLSLCSVISTIDHCLISHQPLPPLMMIADADDGSYYHASIEQKGYPTIDQLSLLTIQTDRS